MYTPSFKNTNSSSKAKYLSILLEMPPRSGVGVWRKRKPIAAAKAEKIRGSQKATIRRLLQVRQGRAGRNGELFYRRGRAE